VSWTDAQKKKAIDLFLNTKFNCREISEKVGKTAQDVRWFLNKKGHKPSEKLRKLGTIGKWNAKHSHLREKAMTYFLTHSFEETQEKFKLKRSELKSLFTVGYRMPEFAHLRKDKRRKDVWSQKETLFLLRNAGIRDRKWIAEKLRRGTMHSVKEACYRLHLSSKYVNGIPEKWVNELLPCLKLKPIKTQAGPKSAYCDFQFKIIPWVMLYDLIKYRKKIPEHLRSAIKAMAKFQHMIYDEKNSQVIINQIKRRARQL